MTHKLSQTQTYTVHSQAHNSTVDQTKPFYSRISNDKTLLNTHSVVSFHSLIGDAVCKLLDKC